MFQQKGAEYLLMVGRSRRRVADLSSSESIPFVTSTSLLAGDSSADDATDGVAVEGGGRYAPPRLWLWAAGLLIVLAALRVAAMPASGHHSTRADPTTPSATTGPSVSNLAGPPSLVDTEGCPMSATCLLDLFPDPDLAAAVQARFPGATSTLAKVTLDAHSKKQYRITIEATTRNGVLLTLIAQSYPTGSVQASQGWAFSYRGGTQVAAPANAASGSYVVGGNGYQVTVGLIAAPGHRLATTQAAALAHDPLFDLTRRPRHPPCQVQCTDEGQMRD